MSSGFSHLHVHTSFSMLDGAARHDQLFTRCQQLGMDALAMTDHGNVFGAVDFARAAAKHGVKPIIGMEAYLAPGSRYDRTKATLDGTPLDETNPGEAYTHMTLLAATQAGVRNLFRLSSRSFMEGFYYKPRADRQLLAECADGLIATTGCPGGEIPRLLRAGRFEQACQAASDYRDIFGIGNFYVEFMDHGTDVELRTAAQLHELQRRLNLPPVATNDLHYVAPEDAAGHDALLCVQTSARLDQENRFRFDGNGYYLKSPAEMRALWDTELPQACDNTLLIAERCAEVSFAEDRTLMPRFEVPDGHTETTWLQRESWLGLEARFPAGIPDEYRAQLDYELSVINGMGYPGYFLMVADLVEYARQAGIQVGPGRGSVAGSLVAWALRITGLDPIAHRLVFERFLNPERPSMPDIDLDFEDERRDDMLAYVAAKYGVDHVAQIVTYSVIKSRAAVKDAAKIIHGQPGYALADRITKAMPEPIMGKDIPLAGVFDPEHPRYAEAASVRAMHESDAQAREIIDLGRQLEGMHRQWGVHAAGVIVASRPLIDVIPLLRRPSDGAIVTQFDMTVCESLGLLKMDFLGLRNLSILRHALDNIEHTTGVRLDLDAIPPTDPATYQLLARGDTLGVFQLDSAGMRDLLRRMGPTRFEDISAALALYRPGPMGQKAHIFYADRKNGREPVRPLHKELAAALEPILGETYGLIVYQEQVIEIARQLAGYTMGGADLLRKAMGKKILAVLDKERGKFAEGMRSNGYSGEAVNTLWEILIPFASYAFNRAHSAAYGLIAYWTAYLKTHYPCEYLAALLTSTAADHDRARVYLAEARRLGITVLPPDVNCSAAQYTVKGNAIRVGLASVANVGAPAVADITAGAPYMDFHDYCRRGGKGAANARTVESLIKAGAFDGLGYPRAGLAEICVSALRGARERGKLELAGQLDLFGGLAEVPELAIPDEHWPAMLQLAHEREMLGLYVSGHPLQGREEILEGCTEIAHVLDGTVPDGEAVTVGGALTNISRRYNKTGQPWATLVLEDLAASIEVVFFARAYAKVGAELTEDLITRIRGRVAHKDGRISLIAEGLPALEAATAS